MANGRGETQKDVNVMKQTSFWKDQTGAVTLDWLVLTIAIVGIAVVVLSNVSASLYEPSLQPKTATSEMN